MSQILTPQLIVELRQERYLPLIHFLLQKSGQPWALSENMEKKIIDLRHSIVARNIILFEELQRIYQRLKESSIEAILLKGAMMEAFYPAGLRPFSDIDLLIRFKDLTRIKEILSALGYRLYSRPMSNDEEHFQIEVTLLKDGDLPFMVEPHWALAPYNICSGHFSIDAWKRANRKSVCSVSSLVLCPEDALLHSCLHFFVHYRAMRGLYASCDIAELVYSYGSKLDWEAFVSRVFEYDAGLPVQLALQQTAAWFKPPVPSLVLQKLSGYKPTLSERLVYFLLTVPWDKSDDVSVTLANFIGMPGTKVKFRYLRTIIFPSREFMMSRYNIKKPRLLLLCYLLRHYQVHASLARYFFNFLRYFILGLVQSIDNLILFLNRQ